jgi:hypothetical protein
VHEAKETFGDVSWAFSDRILGTNSRDDNLPLAPSKTHRKSAKFAFSTAMHSRQVIWWVFAQVFLFSRIDDCILYNGRTECTAGSTLLEWPESAGMA